MSWVGRLIGFGDRSQGLTGPVLRSEYSGVALARVGLIAIVLVTVGAYFAFSKSLPWQRAFELNAVFYNAIDIRADSPVRVAGINVGKVERISRSDGSKMTKVTMKLEDNGLPIKKDATLKIRPMLFLEGNYFVEIKAGSPSAPALKSGATIPVTQTAAAVQMDEVLTALQADSRQDLRELLKGLSEGFDSAGKGTLSGAQAVNRNFSRLEPALKNGARVTQAFLGEEPDDLSRLIVGFQRTVSALDQNEEQLKGLVTNFNTTNAALASQSTSLSATVRELPGTLRTARNALSDLDRSLPATRAFAKDILPGVREIPATVDASPEWLSQLNALLGKDELGGLASKLRPTVGDLADLADKSIDLLDQVNQLSVCSNKVLLPTANAKVQDPPNTSDTENWKEFFYALTGVSGAIQNFDGNGPVLSMATRGGNATVSLGKPGGLGGEVFGNASPRNLPLGQRPQVANPLKRPPYRPQVDCSGQSPPDLNAAQTGAPPRVVATGSSSTGATSVQKPGSAGPAVSSAGGSGGPGGESK